MKKTAEDTTEGAVVRKGARLKNGALVIDLKRIGSHGTVYVLAMWPKGERSHEYVTWEVDREGYAFHGHYFPDLVHAVEDLANRG